MKRHPFFAILLLSGCAPAELPELELDVGPEAGSVELNLESEIESAFDFIRADFGGVLQDGEVKAAGSQVDWRETNTEPTPIALVAGVTGGSFGAILDVGVETDESSFSDLEWDGGRDGNMIMNETPVADGLNSFTMEGWLNGSKRSIVPEDGHLAAVRVQLDGDSKFDLVVKIRFTKVEPPLLGFDWVRLRYECDPDSSCRYL